MRGPDPITVKAAATRLHRSERSVRREVVPCLLCCLTSEGIAVVETAA